MYNQTQTETMTHNFLIKLTKAEELSLLAFPTAALTYAEDNFDSSISNATAYHIMKELCASYCTSHGIRANWKAVKAPFLDSSVHRQSFTSGSSVSSPSGSRRSGQGPPQQGRAVAFFTTEVSPEYREKLRKSEERYPTLLKDWQTKMPHT